MDDAQVKAALAGAANLAPLTSKHPKKALVTVNLMECIFQRLDSSDPLDAVVMGCFLLCIMHRRVHTLITAQF